ncbi:alpha/beta hydrolase [Halorhabdus sp. CBA1104]|uniref:alpha/beta hydrolase n=1 Tax=unclassified Halorhabdus TaxID=2621901 RepID=UPI0012B1D951|nr:MULTISPECIES: alpha/beta hydrolase [unclassified Halorhabdus]QGN07740.1 alpha/beta hydrolase [Halorhabdus sp. CBA1104]
MSESPAGTEDDPSGADGPAVAVHEDVTYASRDSGDLRLDLFVPETAGRPPLVVYVHGGGWVFETRKNAPALQRYAAEWGVAIASVSYRLAEIPDGVAIPFDIDPENPTPRGVFPDQILDVKAAIRWLQARAEAYGFDPDRIATWGASAGGHLALLAGFVDDVSDVAGNVYAPERVEKTVAPEQSGAVQAVVDWYGVTDLTAVPVAPAGVASLLVGGSISQHRDRARRASPLTYVDADSPPVLVMHGRADDVVSIEQTRSLVSALRGVDLSVTSYELHGMGHVFGADSERTAMAQLTGEERPTQTVTASASSDPGASDDRLLPAHPFAGPDAIETFLDRTL